MHDVDHDRLYDVAESQAGYFTAGQAIEAGMDRSTLRYHARPGGRYERVGRGIYRLRHFPSSPLEHVVAAWLPLRPAHAVVSHESALELYDLADVIPDAVHVSLPRSQRGQRPRAGVRLHTLARPLGAGEVRDVAGIATTTPERTIIDCAETGTQPEQIELAIRQALQRGLTTHRRLTEAAATRSSRTRELIQTATTGAQT
ncbi:type IV toxin-antitoxin system AbiEi family antitoxin domain-containing protein [Actinotalea sp. M2MS4P-6]|uniref:type IV toxin-antitoxin system AbiEi family antitoxin domain-containing protein n=1 Tax=Actinotalea sp. M2MS4P-6 TaxID=2983762 RepID=UPI0021E395AC|nr:type IV toxin-antitoxin system AbiEi family antitoxin domain-containing protein [Actinotalea sp. M2MS4P-6]MCV2393706.1 type IV toxin-antitoxin system AbiEi family antitoxin domain-containing protein [Actinotalea sp. M2MS4P-6]